MQSKQISNTMKRFIILSLMMVSTLVAMASPTDTIYYNFQWKGCPKTEAEYFRVLFPTEGKEGARPYRDYYITGELQGECHYRSVDRLDDDRSIFVGLYTTYYRSGKMKQKGQYNSEGQFVGDMTEWYEDGQKAWEQHYDQQGRLNGVVREYYPSGRLSRVAPYTDGEPHGDECGYYENGNLKYRLSFRNGLLHGEKLYHGADSIRIQAQYWNDTLTSSWARVTLPNGRKGWMDLNSSRKEWDEELFHAAGEPPFPFAFAYGMPISTLKGVKEYGQPTVEKAEGESPLGIVQAKIYRYALPHGDSLQLWEDRDGLLACGFLRPGEGRASYWTDRFNRSLRQVDTTSWEFFNHLNRSVIQVRLDVVQGALSFAFFQEASRPKPFFLSCVGLTVRELMEALSNLDYQGVQSGLSSTSYQFGFPDSTQGLSVYYLKGGQLASLTLFTFPQRMEGWMRGRLNSETCYMYGNTWLYYGADFVSTFKLQYPKEEGRPLCLIEQLLYRYPEEVSYQKRGEDK